MFLATPGFLTPQSSGFDPDALAYFTAVENAGGTLTETVKTAWNEFVLREKGASRYSNTLRLYPYLGGVIDSARIDAISLASATNFNFVDANADTTCGLTGNTGTKYLNILFNPTTDLAGNNFMFYTFNLNGAATGNFVQGGYIGSNFFVLYSSLSTLGISARFNNSANITSSPRIASGSSIHAIRTGDSDLRLFRDGVQVGIDITATTSTTLPNLNIFTHATNNSGSSTGFYVPDKLGCNMIAENFSIVDSQEFDTSYKTFLTEIGAI